MAGPNPFGNPDTRASRLANAFLDMRDELLRASLLLQDLRFQLDSEQRNAAEKYTKEWLEKVKSR